MVVSGGAVAAEDNRTSAVDDDLRAQGYEVIHPRCDPLGVLGPKNVPRAELFPEGYPLVKRVRRLEIYSNDLESLVPVLLLETRERWSLQRAGRSTREGEVQQHHLTFQIRHLKLTT